MFMFLRDVCEREVALSCETRREGGGESDPPWDKLRACVVSCL